MKYTKIIAAVLAILLSAGATGLYAKGQETNSEPASQTRAAENTSYTRVAEDGPAVKDETVYVLCSNGNEVKNIIVSDWLFRS